jgi:hypothetical protein
LLEPMGFSVLQRSSVIAVLLIYLQWFRELRNAQFYPLSRTLSGFPCSNAF